MAPPDRNPQSFYLTVAVEYRILAEVLKSKPADGSTEGFDPRDYSNAKLAPIALQLINQAYSEKGWNVPGGNLPGWSSEGTPSRKIAKLLDEPKTLDKLQQQFYKLKRLPVFKNKCKGGSQAIAWKRFLESSTFMMHVEPSGIEFRCSSIACMKMRMREKLLAARERKSDLYRSLERYDAALAAHHPRRKWRWSFQITYPNL